MTLDQSSSSGATLLLSDDEVRRACDMAAVVDAVEAALGAAPGPPSATPPRSDLGLEGGFFRVMPAVVSQAGVLGLKMMHGSFERGVRYLVVLCDLDTGAVTGVLDAAHLTAARTGATAGVATRALARRDAASVGVIGAGAEAESNLAAVAAVRGIERVRVFSPRPWRRAAFAERMSAELGIEVAPVDSAEAAVAGTDVVVVATNTGSGGPVALRGEWIEPGQHIVSIGSTTPSVRELDVAVLARADAVAFDVPAEVVAAESVTSSPGAGSTGRRPRPCPRWGSCCGRRRRAAAGPRTSRCSSRSGPGSRIWPPPSRSASGPGRWGSARRSAAWRRSGRSRRRPGRAADREKPKPEPEPEPGAGHRPAASRAAWRDWA